jgi:ankyrin repeat protein
MTDNLFAGYNYEHEYSCSSRTRSNHFTKIMYLIINSNTIDYNSIKIYILNNKKEINEKNSRGWTALMIVVRNSRAKNNFDIIKLLLDNGANINDINNYKCISLMYAAANSNRDSNIETVELLLDNDADVNKINEDGFTALLYVIKNSTDPDSRDWNSNIETIELLLKKGSDYNVRNRMGYSFFSLIKFNEKNEFLLKLIYQTEHAKMCMKKVLRDIKTYNHKFILNPDSIRISLVNMKWNLNEELYETLTQNNHWILKYLGIYDEESLKLKILDVTKFMD